jgi:hypothetical protein
MKAVHHKHAVCGVTLRVTRVHFSTNLLTFLHGRFIRVKYRAGYYKGKVVPVLNELNTTP